MKKVSVEALVSQALNSLQQAGVGKKALKDYKYCGMGPIIRHFAERGVKTYSKAEADSLMLQVRADYEQGEISRWKWNLVRKSAAILENIYTTGMVNLEPLPKWEVLHNPLHQKPSPKQLRDKCDIFSLVYHTKQELLKFGLSPKTIRNYTYEGFDPILRYCTERGITKYAKDEIDKFIIKARSDYQQQEMYRSKYQNIRKAADLLNEYYNTGTLEWSCLPNWGTRKDSGWFSAVLESYCEEKNHTGALAKGTVTTNKSAIRSFLFCLEDLGYQSFGQVTRKAVNDCIPILSSRYPCGMNGMMSAVRSFLEFLNERKIPNDDLLASIPEIVAPRRKIRKGFSTEEIDMLLAATDRETDMGKRDYAMMMMAVQTGLRVVDISGLTYKNIDWRSMEIRITQHKTDRPLSLPLEPETGNAVAEYLLYGRPECDSPYLFLCKNKPYRKLHNRSGSGITTRYMGLAGIDHSIIKRRGFHSFRRSFGARMLEAEIPVEMLVEILGQAHMDSAKPYIAADEKGLRICALGLTGIEVTGGELL